MPLFLGIDLGSTSLKAIIYDERGNVAAKGARPTLRFHPNPERPEWTIWDPEQIWNDTAAAIREAVSQIADPLQIKGAAVTGMGMDGVPMDESGKWLYPFISWHDPRTKPQYDWWMKNVTAEKSFAIGGNCVWPINSALRILWIRENEPEIYRNTHKWLLIEDFVNHALSGRFVTDFSMASCTMLFDQRTQSWSDEMSQNSGIPVAMMPEALPSSTFLGEVTPQAARQTGLPGGTPVYLGGHDHICCGLPVGAFRPGGVLDITGTWETVHFITDNPPLDPSLLSAGVTVQSHVAREKLYSVWGGGPAGEMIEWYRREIASSPKEDGSFENWDWRLIMELAQSSPPGAGGVLFLPHMNSASCPIVDPKSLGVFVGLSNRTSRGDLIRALIEGLDYQFLDTVRAMETAISVNAKEFIAVGGAIRNAFWMQNKADMIARPIRVPDVDEATVLGAAMLAGIGAGFYKDAEDAFAHVEKESTVYTPDESISKIYDEFFPIYRDMYRAVAPINHRIYEKTVARK